ncbi:MAG: HAD hydrolase family protein, partial [Endomicrobium sp.]|nr:HAD hydrolase family protein [Endomicrobium sp.]
LVSNCSNKKEALDKISKENGFDISEVAYIGDDIIDITVLKGVGFSACPKDACEDVKNCVNYISSFNGGEGAVREIIERIVKAKSEWQRILDTYVCQTF